MADLPSLKNLKTFCVYPWIEQTVQPTGKVSYCCVAKEGGVITDKTGFYLAGESKLSSAWNSPVMKQTRTMMLNNQMPSQCRTCTFQESIQKKSYRQMHNEEWFNMAGDEVVQRVNNSLVSGMSVDQPPAYLDLRLGNVCNLKCRMCNSFNSSKIFAETSRLLKSDPEFKEFWDQNEYSEIARAPKWYEDDRFWDEVISYIPSLKKVYLTGGEPTLIEKNYEFLQACIDQGKAKDIFLMFNINGTNVEDRFLDIIRQYKFVLINVSVDGFGRVNEYIRSGSKWSTVSENLFRLLLAEGNIQVGVTPVFQVYNALNIHELLEFIEFCSKETGRNINVDFLYATAPGYLYSGILPPEIKSESLSRLAKFAESSELIRVNEFLKNSIESAIHLMKKEEQDEKQLKDFFKYTKILDRARKESFEDSIPELWQRLRQLGYLHE